MFFSVREFLLLIVIIFLRNVCTPYVLSSWNSWFVIELTVLFFGLKLEAVLFNEKGERESVQWIEGGKRLCSLENV